MSLGALASPNVPPSPTVLIPTFLFSSPTHSFPMTPRSTKRPITRAPRSAQPSRPFASFAIPSCTERDEPPLLTRPAEIRHKRAPSYNSLHDRSLSSRKKRPRPLSITVPEEDTEDLGCVTPPVPTKINLTEMAFDSVTIEGPRGFYGLTSRRGKRKSIEDAFRALPDVCGNPHLSLYGVFDGHGGRRAVDYVSKNLFSNIIDNPLFRKDPSQALASSFEKTDEDFLHIARKEGYTDGTTALVVFIDHGTLFVANTGDCRAVLSSAGRAEQITRDHTLDCEEERQRVTDAGGSVLHIGCWRLNGVLAVSRALGDMTYKEHVIAKPDVLARALSWEDEFIVLATDGLWNAVTNEEAVDVARESVLRGNPQDAAANLVRKAVERGSSDDTSVLVIDLRRHVSRAAACPNSCGAECSSPETPDSDISWVSCMSSVANESTCASDGNVESSSLPHTSSRIEADDFDVDDDDDDVRIQDPPSSSVGGISGVEITEIGVGPDDEDLLPDG